MSIERTLSIIKPDATERNIVGKIIQIFESAGLRIIAQKRVQLDRVAAEGFYDVHRDRPFFNELCSYMISGPIVIQVLEGQDAVSLNRDLMGATDPSVAKDNTIRKIFGRNIQENSVHGSDSIENAKKEIEFFFSDEEIVG